MMNRADGSEIHSLLQSNLIELSKLQSNLSELNDYGLESEVSNSRSLDRGKIEFLLERNNTIVQSCYLIIFVTSPFTYSDEKRERSMFGQW